MSILVVDDQLVNRVTLARLLETFNFPVLQATNGLEGLELYRQHRANVALIFLDLMMPVLDGWATALKLRSMEEEHDWLNVPIVAYTSEDVSLGSPMWTRCIESGMNDVVGKPINKSFTYQLLSRYVPFWTTPPPPPPPSVSSSCSTSPAPSREAHPSGSGTDSNCRGGDGSTSCRSSIELCSPHKLPCLLGSMDSKDSELAKLAPGGGGASEEPLAAVAGASDGRQGRSGTPSRQLPAPHLLAARTQTAARDLLHRPSRPLLHTM